MTVWSRGRAGLRGLGPGYGGPGRRNTRRAGSAAVSDRRAEAGRPGGRGAWSAGGAEGRGRAHPPLST